MELYEPRSYLVLRDQRIAEAKYRRDIYGGTCSFQRTQASMF